MSPIDNLHEKKKTPKLPNMKISKFSSRKMKQLNLNREKAFAYLTCADHKQLSIERLPNRKKTLAARNMDNVLG